MEKIRQELYDVYLKFKDFDFMNYYYENIKEHKIFNIKQKYDSTFVTESDLLVEKMIIDDIESQYGNDNFVTEEFNNEKVISKRNKPSKYIKG